MTLRSRGNRTRHNIRSLMDEIAIHNPNTTVTLRTQNISGKDYLVAKNPNAGTSEKVEINSNQIFEKENEQAVTNLLSRLVEQIGNKTEDARNFWIG